MQIWRTYIWFKSRWPRIFVDCPYQVILKFKTMNTQKVELLLVHVTGWKHERLTQSDNFLLAKFDVVLHNMYGAVAFV